MKNQRPTIHQARPGDIVTFVMGPGDFPQPEHARHVGKAYGFIRNRRFGDLLRVKMPDGTFEAVATFTDVGIGAYLFPRKH